MLDTKMLELYTLPNDTFLDWSKLKEPCRDKINVAEKFKSILGREENIVGKRRKCWLPAFSPFPAMFSEGFFPRVVNSRDCVVEV